MLGSGARMAACGQSPVTRDMIHLDSDYRFRSCLTPPLSAAQPCSAETHYQKISARRFRLAPSYSSRSCGGGADHIGAGGHSRPGGGERSLRSGRSSSSGMAAETSCQRLGPMALRMAESSRRRGSAERCREGGWDVLADAWTDSSSRWETPLLREWWWLESRWGLGVERERS